VSLVGIGLFLIIILAIAISFGSLRGLMLKVRGIITKINGTVINRINTVQLIKTTGTEDYEKDLFAKLHVDYAKAFQKMIAIQSLVIMFLLVGINSIQIVLTVAAALIYANDQILLITLIPSMILAIGVMIGPLMQLVRVISGIVMASSSSQRIYSILASKSRINAHLKPNEGIHIGGLTGDVIFKNVTFAYPEKPSTVIIPNFNFTFEKGKKYAFVGETGSGKSTISKLLLRFYDPTLGEVLINNNINLKDVNLPSYLKNVGYVEQEPSMFLGDVFENIKYGSKGATNEEVIEAAKKADLHNLISS
jgi:ATP-binding cassette subfamily B protein